MAQVFIGGKVPRPSTITIDPIDLDAAIRTEKQRTSSWYVARERAMDNLKKDPHYYQRLSEKTFMKKSKAQKLIEALNTVLEGCGCNRKESKEHPCADDDDSDLNELEPDFVFDASHKLDMPKGGTP
jgi:hypothetical protein